MTTTSRALKKHKIFLLFEPRPDILAGHGHLSIQLIRAANITHRKNKMDSCLLIIISKTKGGQQMVLLFDWSQLHSAVRWPARYSIYIILVKMCLGAKESAVISSSTEGIRIDWRECITGEVRSFYLCRWGGRAGGACPRLL